MSKKNQHSNTGKHALSFGRGFGWSSIYFVGIGGIGMSAIARYFSSNGIEVAGYDKTPSQITKALEDIGAKIHFEDSVKNIPISFLDNNKTLVVYTPALPADHLELAYFFEHNFKVVKRSEILGKITENTYCMAVAGTHGKTTTSAILGHLMREENATAFLGGIAENYNSNLILGNDKISVVEADEFDRSFLRLSPNIACITSMDADHLDIYGEHEALKESFIAFANRVSDTLILAKGLPLKGLTYAIDEAADYKAFNVKVASGKYVFDVQTPSETITNIEFHLPGKHNVMNALAALAMADVYGVKGAQIKRALKTFKGVHRRFSYRIISEELILIDDYAHHPTEINAVENSVREMYPKEKVLAIFQPHLFSRTRDFIADFAVALSKFDELILLDIYPARELPITGVTSSWLLDKVTLENKQMASKENLITKIKKSSAKIVVMMGAGDIGVLVNEVKEQLNLVKKT
jgi:UDP-N-acetylmuramate--alanine ligase